MMFTLRRACLILASLLASCQTPVKTEAQSKQEQVLESQRAMVRNALDSGKPEAALESLRQLLRQWPDDATLHNLMGMAQLALKNATRAVKEFTKAYALDHQIGTGLNLSSAYLETGDYHQAETLLLELSERAEREAYPLKERLYHNLGYTYTLEKNNAKAESWLKQAIEENPTFFPTQLELARLYQRTKRPALALSTFRRSMDFCIVCIEPVQALTAIYVKSGRSDEARRLLIKYAKIEGITPEDRTRAGRLLQQINALAAGGAKPAKNARLASPLRAPGKG